MVAAWAAIHASLRTTLNENSSLLASARRSALAIDSLEFEHAAAVIEIGRRIERRIFGETPGIVDQRKAAQLELRAVTNDGTRCKNAMCVEAHALASNGHRDEQLAAGLDYAGELARSLSAAFGTNRIAVAA